MLGYNNMAFNGMGVANAAAVSGAYGGAATMGATWYPGRTAGVSMPEPAVISAIDEGSAMMGMGGRFLGGGAVMGGFAGLPGMAVSCGGMPVVCETGFIPSSLDSFLLSFLESVSVCNGFRLSEFLARDGSYLYSVSAGLNNIANALTVRAEMVGGIAGNINSIITEGVISPITCDIAYLAENLAVLGNIMCNITQVLNRIGLGANQLGNDINILDNTANNFILRELMASYADSYYASYELKNLAYNVYELGTLLSESGIDLCAVGGTLESFGQDFLQLSCILNDLGITDLGACFGGCADTCLF